MKTGKPARQDGEYIRNGTCSIFIFTEPYYFSYLFNMGTRKLSGRAYRWSENLPVPYIADISAKIAYKSKMQGLFLSVESKYSVYYVCRSLDRIGVHISLR